MAILAWDETGKKIYETGTKKGVLYLKDITGAYSNGVAWNGLTGVTESPSGAEESPFYADDIKYLALRSVEEYAATIEAYTYPKEFEACNGEAEVVPGVVIGQQKRSTFGMAYSTIIGNDVDLDDHGYKLHIIYGATVPPSEKAYASVNDSPEPVTFSFEISTTPVAVTGHKPTASITIDSTLVDATKLKALEDILYGTADVEPRLPLPDEIATLMKAA